MFARYVAIAAIGLFAAAVIGRVAYAAEDTHEGKVVSVAKDSLIVLDTRDGDNDKFAVTAETKITRDGKPAKLSDIMAGDRAKVIATGSGDKMVAKSIEAKSPA